MGQHKRNPIALLNAQGEPMLGPEAEADLATHAEASATAIAEVRALLDALTASPSVRDYVARQLACDLLAHFVFPGKERQWVETFSRTISQDFARTVRNKREGGWQPHPQIAQAEADVPPPTDQLPPKETLQ